MNNNDHNMLSLRSSQRHSFQSGSGCKALLAKRSGFTLLEIMLVLGVISVMIAIAVPQVMSLHLGMVIDDSVANLRIELTGLRHLAIDSGATIQFRYEEQGGQYMIAPYDTVAEDSDIHEYSIQDELPESLQFDYSERPSNYPAELEFDELNETQLAAFPSARLTKQVKWAPPVLFYPDGTATDARFVISNEEGSRYEIYVRDLTGAVSTKKVVDD